MKNLRLIFLLAAVLTSAQLAAQDAVYLWPTNAGQFLSSTFGETRSGHYHAGLDIKTWGVEGYKVFASREGYLSRLSILNTGYGKVIYLRHPDSSYTVYAHLMKFNPKFQAFADSLRMDDFNYEMDGEFESDSIFVKQGEVIGYTGSTGIGPPHHHFEIRNADNEPVNPLELNLKIKDTIAPSFLGLLVEPLSPQTTIAGSNLPHTVSPARVKKDSYDFGVIPVNGPVGLAANIIDRADDVYNRYTVYELLLVKEADTLFAQKISRFNFDQAGFMPLDRVPAPGSKTRNYMRLYVKEAADQPFVRFFKDYKNIEYDVPYTIIAKDFFGNTSSATVRFTHEMSAAKELTSFTANDLKAGHWNKDWVAFPDSDYLDLRKHNSEVLWDTATGQYIVDLLDNPNATLTRINPAEKTSITTPDKKFSVTFPASTFYSPASVLHNYTHTDGTLELEIIPDNLPLRDTYDIEVYLGDLFSDYSKTKLYRYEPASGRLTYVPSEVRGRTLRAHTRSLGIFRAAQDTTPPVIQKPFLRKLGTGEVSVSINTRDNLSGIDFKSAVFIVNGIRGIAEYDYEKEQFTYYHPGFRLRKNNTVYFKVKDRAGNTAEAEFRL